jgi:hypothetical protein
MVQRPRRHLDRTSSRSARRRGPIHSYGYDLHATLGWRPLAVQTKRISGWLGRPDCFRLCGQIRHAVGMLIVAAGHFIG